MASAVLHIKDSYYFDVPKFLWPSNRGQIKDFPDVWVRLDADYQLWEAARIHGSIQKLDTAHTQSVPSWGEAREGYLHWKNDHANFAKPFDVYLESHAEWYENVAKADGWEKSWASIKSKAEDLSGYDQQHDWSQEKIEAYNARLSGKILVPQPFGGKLKNFYEADSGFCLSKYMLVEFVVAVLIIAVFSWLGRRVATGKAPKGRLWNFLEVILLYFRDQVVRPTLGGHDDHDGHANDDSDHGHAHDDTSAPHPHATADAFLPLIWTLFVFILGCNLMGMIPWVGAPTSSFSVTTCLACITLGSGFLYGVSKLGPIGFAMNPLPSIDLAFMLSIVIKPMLLTIEWLGFFIKHGVLAVRLLANMVAGHLVLAAIMGLAFGTAAAASFAGGPQWQWGIVAVIAIFGSSAFSLLELFVAFLQAYVFVFLSALFLAAATQKH